MALISEHKTSARIAVDIGGTFTDVVLLQGPQRWTGKVLTRYDAPEEGVIEAIQLILGEAGLGASDLGLFILGTTLATNALIERKGARTALITTAGFRDLLEIGLEDRYAQYDIFLDKPAPLVPRELRFTIDERIDARGRTLLPLDERQVLSAIDALACAGVESVAVAFLQSFSNPVHERAVRALLHQHAPRLKVTLSSDVCPEIREYERLSTACANAYVQPVMARYLSGLELRLGELGIQCPRYLMTSSGALTTFEMGAQQPVRLVESGPAGGAILARHISQECGITRTLSYDMGGTTAKICFIDDYEPQLSRSFEFGRVYRFMKGSGLPIRIPVVEMVEIGAGGGSIARVDSLGRVQVGPDSAASEPGPACFDRGGREPTVTDANCAMGLLDPERFAGGRVRLDSSKAQAAIEAGVAAPMGLAPEMGALAITEIVTEHMANAARVHAVELGKSVEETTMIAFGGAAPLHAARMAAKLGVRRVIVPRSASVGSALGFLMAPVAFHAVRSWYCGLSGLDAAAANRMLAELEEEATAVVRRAAPQAPLDVTRVAYMRYTGQGHEIAIDLPGGTVDAAWMDRLSDRFGERYEATYGLRLPNHGLEFTNWSVAVSTQVEAPPAEAQVANATPAQPYATRRIFDAASAQWLQVPCYAREELAPGASLAGPALITEAQTTVVVTPQFRARISSGGHVVLDTQSTSNTPERLQ